MQPTLSTTNSSVNPGLWIDDSNAAEWADACRDEVACWLIRLAGDAGAAASLKVEVFPPGVEEAQRAFIRNENLFGRVNLSWGEEEVSLRIPMPFHGAFLSARPGLRRGLVSVWGSWLGEAPGFRLVRPADEVEAGRKTLRWSLGLPRGRRLEAKLEFIENAASSKEKDRFDRLKKSIESRYFGNPDLYPESLRSHLALFGLAPSATVEGFLKVIYDLQKGTDPTEEDHLDHRILVTFPVWLKHQISRELLNAVLKRKNNDEETSLGQSVRKVLTGWEEGSQALAREAWAAIRKRGSRVSSRLEWAINGHKSDDAADLVDPINPLDLASRITRIRRVPAARSKLALLKAARRQNLPSFKGRICPLESPESELVGLSLQLASGASVDIDGRIRPADDAPGELGFGARLVPFLAHNDGTRNMMGAKNLRQAVPLRMREMPKVRTGGEKILDDFTRPLVEIGLCPGAAAEEGLGLGRDLLVAYLPWHGRNFEDAIVVGGQVAEDGRLDLSFTQSFRKTVKLGWVPDHGGRPRGQGGFSLGEAALVVDSSGAEADLGSKERLIWEGEPLTAAEAEAEAGATGEPEGAGLARIGTTLQAGSVLARLVWEGAEEVEPLVIRHETRTPAVLRSIRFSRKSAWTGGVLEYEFEMPIPLKPGDKLMGRHGNKGVVGAILPADEMPRLPDSDKLPEELRGRPIDVLLNPHGVISRMNLGQLIETHLGWLLHSGCDEADFRKAGAGGDPALGEPFADAVEHDTVQRLLEESGLDRYGRIRLDLPGGGTTAAPVMVGFQHIVRLRHIPEMKSQARRGDQSALYSARTGQAVRGRRQGGGQRVGEMEMWALAALEAEDLIAEIQGIKSSAELVAMAQPADEVEEGYTGYRRTLQDWLFAMRIKLDFEPEELRFGFASDGEVLDRAAEGRGRVTSPAGLEAAPAAGFRCYQSSRKRTPCPGTLLDGEKIAFPGTPDKAESPTLCLADLLAHFDLRVDGPLVKVGSGYEIPLMDLRTGRATTALPLELKPAGKRALAGKITVGKGSRPPRWPEGLDEVSLYGQLSIGEGASWPAQDLIEEFCKDPEAKRKERADGFRGQKMSDRSVGEMRIACPHHPTKPLSAVKPIGQCLRGEPGGLFDPLIFGSGMPTFTDASSDRWGVIELPLAVPYPKPYPVLGEGKLDWNANYSAFKAFGSPKHPETGMCPVLKLVPVLPAHYRVPGKLMGSLVADRLDRLGYAPLVRLCRQIERERAKWEAQLRKMEENDPVCRDYAEKLGRLHEPESGMETAEFMRYLEKDEERRTLLEVFQVCQAYALAAEELSALEEAGGKAAERRDKESSLRYLRENSEECRRFAEIEEALRKMEEGSSECRSFAETVRRREAELSALRSRPECLDYAGKRAETERKLREFAVPIQKQLQALFQLLVEALEGKQGLVRRDGLGRRVDRSARLVVVPNPGLTWDRAGIPATVLMELMGDRLQAWLDRMDKAERDKLPELKPVSWLRPRENPGAVVDGLRILQAYLEDFPNFVVLLNRQPSLHRDSVQAFHPVPLPPEAGEVIQLCPLACKGFGADFDGDEMVVHLPLGIHAQVEALSLLPSANLLSLASEAPDNVLAHFDQDFVLGSWWMCRNQPEGTRQALENLMPAECRSLIPQAEAEGFKKAAAQLLHALAAKSGSGGSPAETTHAWMRKAFEACTLKGVSFGFYELREIAQKATAGRADLESLPPEKINKALDELAAGLLGGMIAPDVPADEPGLGFAAMALSGARGGKQVRQILAARGLLDPGATAFPRDLKRFVFRRSLVEGLSPEDAFWAAMNARSSMCDKKIGTAFAGGMTRNLVFALWDYRIVSKDCGSDAPDRSPVSCKEAHGFCARCHGPLPGGAEPALGFPAGLIAAQVIGERGTQLSMQSFHEGASAVNIQWVRYALGLDNAPPPGVKERPFAFGSSEQAPDFVAGMKGIKAYEGLLDRHFQILWRALHDLKNNRTVAEAIRRKDPLTRIAHRRPADEILTAAMLRERHGLENPFAGVLFGKANPQDTNEA